MLEFNKNAILGNIGGEPLCADYKRRWRMCGDDKGKLVNLAMMQQSLPYFVTACHNGLGLTKEYIKENFKDYINGCVLNDCDGVSGYTYALYVDWDYENDLKINTDVASIMWTVGANIIVQNTKCPAVYISNRSNVHLVCDGYNSINVKLFDDSVLTIEDLDENSNVVVYKYGGDAKVELGKYCLGSVKVFPKELRL